MTLLTSVTAVFLHIIYHLLDRKHNMNIAKVVELYLIASVIQVAAFLPNLPSISRAEHQLGSLFPISATTGGGDDDGLDMESLQKRIDKQKNQYHDLFSTNDDDDEIEQQRPEEVYIILFRPDTDDQGVHTIEYPAGTGRNVLLAFESEDECVRFAGMLSQDMLPSHIDDDGKRLGVDPVPRATNLLELENFCEETDMLVKFVREGTNLSPPPDSIDSFDLDAMESDDDDGEDENDADDSDKDDDDDNETFDITQQPGAWE